MDTLEKLNGVVETLNNQNTTNMDLFTELGNVLRLGAVPHKLT